MTNFIKEYGYDVIGIITSAIIFIPLAIIADNHFGT